MHGLTASFCPHPAITVVNTPIQHALPDCAIRLLYTTLQYDDSINKERLLHVHTLRNRWVCGSRRMFSNNRPNNVSPGVAAATTGPLRFPALVSLLVLVLPTSEAALPGQAVVLANISRRRWNGELTTTLLTPSAAWPLSETYRSKPGSSLPINCTSQQIIRYGDSPTLRSVYCLGLESSPCRFLRLTFKHLPHWNATY